VTSPGSVFEPTFRGHLSDIQPGDLVGLVTNGAHKHLGLPAQAVADFPAEGMPFPRLLDPSGTLTPGDVYMFTVSSLLERLINLPNYTASLTADVLSKIGARAASGAVAVIGVLPIAWHVPNPAGAPMPPTVPHVRLSWSGTFGPPGTPAEIWSWGLKTTAPAGPIDGPGLLTRATLMETTYMAHINMLNPPWVVLTECRYAVTGADGKVLRFGDGAYQQGKLGVSHQGTSTTPGPLPLQTALVVSLGTQRPGPTGKGRVFLPFQAQVLQPDFRLASDFCGTYASAVASLIKDVNGLGSPVSIISSKAYASTVTSTRCGRVPDTMRSRRNRLLEGYVGSPIPA